MVAWVNVAHGCNERCTYCVVPNTRGVEQSRTPRISCGRLISLGRSGYREVTLLVSSSTPTGRDMRVLVCATLLDLAEAVAWSRGEHGNMRVRFVWGHPRHVSPSNVMRHGRVSRQCWRDAGVSHARADSRATDAVLKADGPGLRRRARYSQSRLSN